MKLEVPLEVEGASSWSEDDTDEACNDWNYGEGGASTRHLSGSVQVGRWGAWRRRGLGAGGPWGLAPEPASSGGREARRGPSFSWGREAASGGGKVMREGDGLPLRRCGGRHQA